MLMAGIKIAPDLSLHVPFEGGDIMPSVPHSAPWMFAIAQQWWHSGLCEPPQSQDCMERDHGPHVPRLCGNWIMSLLA